MRPESITGVVLAGGASSRMGRDKAELTLGGRTLTEIQVEKLRKLGIGDILLSGSGMAPPGVRQIPDIHPGLGPLSGIHACLQAAKAPACLVLSVDVPLFPAEALGELIAAHTAGITVLACGGEIEPLIAVYDSSLAPRAEELLLSDSRKVRSLMRGVPVRELPFTGSPDALLNCNTPEDFARAEALWNAPLLTAYRPEYRDLRFRQELLGDARTMSYNRAWGGTIPFPEEQWADWYDRWVLQPPDRRYYRYLRDRDGTFVGEMAYHFDPDLPGYLADVIIFAPYRGRGYGGLALDLLCAAAKENGASALWDNIAADNPAISLFRKHGFTEAFCTENEIFLKKEL